MLNSRVWIVWIVSGILAPAFGWFVNNVTSNYLFALMTISGILGGSILLAAYFQAKYGSKNI